MCILPLEGRHICVGIRALGYDPRIRTILALHNIDEHKLECAIPMLANEALSWWETTTLTAPTEKITWKFFVEEFKKKYISEQYLNDLYIKTENDKCQKFTDGLNDELGPMFTAMEIEDFQILVNRAIATKAKMKVVERRKGGSRSDNRKQKMDDRS
ncbi:hypothetical protein V6N11_021624 [Hibiscus sabdariffa]|uniref:Retrotransposon gag domain-containing protein n=1 Tax=Hibiscus sabdariffa TaxID=183260 RepID=A0ABR2PBW7_9ROSI